jgi:hypothetical protein
MGNFITLMMHNSIQYRILFLEYSSTKPLILPECTSDPSLIENFPWQKKYYFVAMRLAQKCESRGYQKTIDKAFEPTYFRLRSVCRTPSPVNNLQSQFPRRVVFLTSRSWIPSPPWSFGDKPHSTWSVYTFFTITLCCMQNTCMKFIVYWCIFLHI